MKNSILFVIALMLSLPVRAFDISDYIDVPDKHINNVFTSDLSEVECMALNIYHEARGESLLGRQLVAQTVMNRVGHNSYPNTVCGVVNQHRQFSWTQDGRSDNPFNRQAYRRAYAMSILFVDTGFTSSIKYAGLILNYHTLDVSPKWDHVESLLVQDDHVFYVRSKELVAYKALQKRVEIINFKRGLMDNEEQYRAEFEALRLTSTAVKWDGPSKSYIPTDMSSYSQEVARFMTIGLSGFIEGKRSCNDENLKLRNIIAKANALALELNHKADSILDEAEILRDEVKRLKGIIQIEREAATRTRNHINDAIQMLRPCK